MNLICKTQIKQLFHKSEAAEESSVSRLYKGIHFRDAITEGICLGKRWERW
ncbi:MAG: hypothetical protein K9I82_13815 [Chitinophagaceae bacterium]|nr:hypothetical protein [Chitinophagaceae bacterium]